MTMFSSVTKIAKDQAMDKLTESKLTSLSDAIESDNLNVVVTFQETEPQLVRVAARTWEENPLLVACKHGSIRVALQIAKKNPGFARKKNRDGDAALHLASANGYLELVKALVAINHKLCFAKDRSGMIPLHKAIKNGHEDVIKELIRTSPDSVTKTISGTGETIFHLAVKLKQYKVFPILLEEIKKLNKEHILHKKDHKGNNIVHIATSNKQIEVLLSHGSTCRFSVLVNSLNKRRLTALDVFYENSCWDATDRQIHEILYGAGAPGGGSLRASLRWTLEIKNVILVVLAMVTGAAFTTVCNLPEIFLKDGHVADGVIFPAVDVVSCKLPSVFYLMVFNTAMLLVCMVASVVLLWSIPFRPVMLFVTITVAIVYLMLMHGIIPKFAVQVSSTRNILSSILVVVLAITILLSAVVLYYMVWCACYAFARLRALATRMRLCEGSMVLLRCCLKRIFPLMLFQV